VLIIIVRVIIYSLLKWTTTTCTVNPANTLAIWPDSRSITIVLDNPSKWTHQHSTSSFIRWKLKCQVMCFSYLKPTTLLLSRPPLSQSAEHWTRSQSPAKTSMPCLTYPTKTSWKWRRVRPRKKRNFEFKQSANNKTLSAFKKKYKSGIPFQMRRSPPPTQRRLSLWRDLTSRPLKRI